MYGHMHLPLSMGSLVPDTLLIYFGGSMKLAPVQILNSVHTACQRMFAGIVTKKIALIVSIECDVRNNETV